MDIADIKNDDALDLESNVNAINEVPLIAAFRAARYVFLCARSYGPELSADAIEDALDMLWQEGARFEHDRATALLNDSTFEQWLADNEEQKS